MQTATKIPDFQPIFNILLPKCVCLRGSASDPTGGLPAPPASKRWVSPLQRAPQNCGPQGPETPRSATAYVRTRRHSTNQHNVLPRTTPLTERRTLKHHYRHSHYHNDMQVYHRDGNDEYVTVMIFCIAFEQ